MKFSNLLAISNSDVILGKTSSDEAKEDFVKLQVSRIIQFCITLGQEFSSTKAGRIHDVLIKHQRQRRKGGEYVSPNSKKSKVAKKSNRS